MNRNNQDQALALLALTTRIHKKPQKQILSDEDLAAFIDDSLSKADRIRIQKHIASDQSTYQRWVQTIDNRQILSSNSSLEHEIPNNSSSTKKNISSLLSLNWAKPFLGSSVITALLIITILPKNTPIDSFYETYPLQHQLYISENFHSKSLPFSNKPIIAQAVEYGIYKRLSGLKKKEIENNVGLKTLSTSLPTPTNKVTQDNLVLAQEVGELALLHNNHCQDAHENAQYFKDTEEYTKLLIDRISTTETLKQFRFATGKQTSKIHVQCQFSQQIFSAL